MEEIWKDVVGYEGYYKVSNLGNVKSLTRTIHQNNYTRVIKGKNISPAINGSGYLQCLLCKNGYRYQAYVHKLVAEAFLENKNNYQEVNHINHNKLDNSITNLEWCTRKENMIKMVEYYGISRNTVYCDDCSIEINYDSKLCVSCLGIRNRKVKIRPTKIELINLLKENNFSKVGKLYGISDNAVRKWCRDYEISDKAKDYK